MQFNKALTHNPTTPEYARPRKRRVPLLIVRLVAVDLVASFAAIAAAAQSTFQHSVRVGTGPTNNYSAGSSVEVTFDGGYIAVGTVPFNPVPAQGQIYLAKFTSSGTRQWDWLVGGTPDDSANCVRQTSDQGFVIAGESKLGGTSQSGASLFKTNPAGVVQWGIVYDTTAHTGFGQNEGTVVREVQGGGYILIGTFKPGVGGSIRTGVLLRTDAAGVPTWCFEYSSPPYLSFEDVRQHADGTFTVAGTIQPSSGPTVAMLLHLNAVGSIVWANTYGTGTNSYIGKAVEETASGDLLLSGLLQSGTQTGSFVYRVLTSAGAPVWETDLLGFNDNGSIRETYTGDLALDGTVGSSNAALLKMNSTGGFLWSREYLGFSNANAAREVATTPDGGFVLTGFTDLVSAPHVDLFIAKTNPLGWTGCNEADFMPIVSTPPVPMSSSLTVNQTSVAMTYTRLTVPQTAPSAVDFVTCQSDGCIQPPRDMVLWLTLDESQGSTVLNSGGGNSGTEVGDPVSVGGEVDAALQFDGTGTYVDVPTYTAIDFGTGDFSVDAWVKRAAGDNGVRVIADKRTVFNATAQGFSFYLFNGKLSFQLSDGTFTNYSSLTTVPQDGHWHHVAVSVHRNDVIGGKFFLDGVQAGLAFDTSHHNGSVNSSKPFRVGSMSVGVSSVAGSVFLGGIDEVTAYRRALDPAEIAAVSNAGILGKCKVFCLLPWDSPLCLNQNSVSINLRVCNASGLPQTVNYGFQGLPIGGGCNIEGPSVFAPRSGTVTVPGGTCTPVAVSIARPAGMTAVNLVGCYRAFVQRAGTNDITSCTGSLQDRRDLCVMFPYDWWKLAAALPFPFDPTVTNTGNVSINIPFEITAIGEDMMPNNLDVSLNGMPPGNPVTGLLSLAPGASTSIPLTALVSAYVPLQTFTLLMQADMDGDGIPDPLASMAFTVTIPGSSSSPGTDLCIPGVGGVIACPCGNPQVPAGSTSGCNNSAATGGAILSSSGIASLSTDTLQFTSTGEKPTASSILLQGTTPPLATGVKFGQGVRCIASNIMRLYVHPAVAGDVIFPQGTDAPIHVQSAVKGDSIAAGSSRLYAVYYRDPTVLGGCQAADTFNSSQTQSVMWSQ